ncbi:MAG: hypothetical protein ACKO35_11720, partial [Planctomycetaceae bacterium]
VQLTAAIFQGTKLSITAKPNATSDGRVNVGEIDATGRDLKSVTLAGDLGRIRVGDLKSATPAISALTVQSLGAYGATTGAPDLQTEMKGRAGTISVAGDVKDATLVHSKSADNSSWNTSDSTWVNKLTVGGSLVEGSVVGQYRTISIGGSVVGGSTADSGLIWGPMKQIFVGGDVLGSSGARSGSIQGSAGTKAVIKGTVAGSSGANSGSVVASSIVVGKDVVGGNGLASGSIGHFSLLTPENRPTTITIRGSLFGGAGQFSGWLYADIVKSISVSGGVSGTMAQPLRIAARSAIGTVKIGQTVRQATIRVGYGLPFGDYFSALQPSASTIGSVTIGGNLVESSIVAGVAPGPLGFGVGDTVQEGSTKCTIGSIRIGGSVMENTALTSYGIVGRSIKSLSIAGQKRTLPAPGQSEPIDGTDVRVHILPISLG